jgi:hypothetical protein
MQSSSPLRLTAFIHGIYPYSCRSPSADHAHFAIFVIGIEGATQAVCTLTLGGFTTLSWEIQNSTKTKSSI